MLEHIQLARRQTSIHSSVAREISAAEFIPYYCHWDKETLVTKKKEFVQVIKVAGFSFETADDEDVDMKKAVRNTLLKSMGSGNYSLWFHIVRRRQGGYPEGTMPTGFAQEVNDRWREKHTNKVSFINDLYISIVRRDDTKGAAKIEHFFRGMAEKADTATREMMLKEAHKDLREVTYRVMATLKDYSPRLLTIVETENGNFSEPLEFLGRLVNGGFTQPMQAPTGDVSHTLPTHRLYFGRRAIEIRGAHQTRFASIVSIKEYAAATAAGMIDSFLQLPFEFIVSQSFAYINRQTAIEKMQIQQRRMMNAEDAAVSQVAEISNALDMAMSGHVAFGEHHFTVMPFADNIKALEEYTSMVVAELVNIGVNAVREQMILEACYWAQLPANHDYVARKAVINTMNLSAFSSLHNYPVGNYKGNHWGNAVTVLDTSSGTPYYFNFHSRDVGHTTIIGPTGGGKTVLMNFLCAQAQKFKCRMFAFDKDHGAEIYIRAMRGHYTDIQPGIKCHFNPLKLPDTSENRAFLMDWFRAMLTINDEPFTHEDMAMVMEAISGNYKLAPKDRILRNVAPFFGIEGPGKAASRLKMWHGSGQYAGLFDNDEDKLDFSLSPIYGFEMGEVLADRISLGPVLLYLFHRIHLSLDGTPTMIVLDEAWALIDNPIFAPRIKDWLKTMRKLNAMVVFATQSVEDATKSNISDTLVQQTATQIFLPNLKATDDYRKAFMLSEREFNLLKTTDPGSRFFLLKQSNDVVIARIDLSGMEDIVHVLSGRAETVEILHEILGTLGEDPDVWLPVFLKRVKALEDAKHA
jgi:type IV secretion system protein VirB4